MKPQVNQPRNVGLDLVRALAIVLVLIGHGSILLAGLIPDTSRQLLLYTGGYFGVELFFALSGCLIVSGLLRQLDVYPVLCRRTILTFWQRRWWRTLPNYAVFLALNASVFTLWFNAPAPGISYLFFVQNLAWPHPPAMGEAWSLAVEEWFYLLLPLLLALSLKALPQPRQAVPVLLGLWVVVGSAARLGVAYWAAPEWDAGLRKIVLLRLDAIAWGGLAACWLHYRPQHALRTARTLFIAGLAAGVACLVWLAVGVLRHFQPVMGYVWLFTLTGASVALCLPWAFYWRPRCQVFIPAITTLSQLSYSLYLVHFSFALSLVQLPGVVAHTSVTGRIAAYLLISVAAAYLAYRLVERPTLALRERWYANPVPGSGERRALPPVKKEKR